MDELELKMESKIMKKQALLIIITLMCLMVHLDGFSRSKLAQTGFQFLSVASDARASSIGEAMTAVEGGSSSLFFNPAGMATTPTLYDVTFSINSWIADIKHSTLSMAVKPSNGQYGVFGISFQYVDYGEIQGTMVWGNKLGYIDTEMLNPSAMAIGLGYAKSITSNFSIGGQIRSTHQSLGKNVLPQYDSLSVKKNLADVLAFDFGTLFKTGIKSLQFGMSLRNFSKEIKYEEEGFQLPLIFSFGISMDLMDFIDTQSFNQSLVFSIDATHPRAHPEQIKMGLNYTLINLLSIRAGYILNNDEDNISFGIGVSQFGMALDYAYTPFGVFENVQRLTARLSL